MLSLESADVLYGKAQVLERLSIDVADGEIVGVVGRNGAGKTTILRTLAGLLQCARGRRLLEGRDVTSLGAHRLSRLGIAYVPEDRQIFPNLTTEENLVIAGVAHPAGHWTIARVYDLFPRLRERAKSKGSALSGGEQQMLSIARAMLTNPKVLMLDEPSEGLAPLIVRAVRDAMVAINRRGVAIVLVEQKIAIPEAIADRIYVIDHGAVAWAGSTAEFRRSRASIEQQITV